MKYQHITHESIPPFVNNESEVLILGSLPSIASRDQGFFYAHPQNRFFKALAGVFNEKEPVDVSDRKSFLNCHKIALYDVIYECDIIGSSDSTIKNVVAIDLKGLLHAYPNIKKIFTTGKKAKGLYDKYLKDSVNIDAIPLPSSSAANANMDLKKLIEEYRIILEK